MDCLVRPPSCQCLPVPYLNNTRQNSDVVRIIQRLISKHWYNPVCVEIQFHHSLLSRVSPQQNSYRYTRPWKAQTLAPCSVSSVWLSHRESIDCIMQQSWCPLMSNLWFIRPSRSRLLWSSSTLSQGRPTPDALEAERYLRAASISMESTFTILALK
jgi:hypothetical protein